MQKYCVHSANNYFLHVDEIAKNDQRVCVIFALAFKMLLAKCTQKATQNTEKFSHIFHKKGVDICFKLLYNYNREVWSCGGGPGAGHSAAVALKGTRSAVSSVPRETGRPPPLWCLRLTRETLCGNKKMAPCFADATQLVRCLSVVRVPVIVAILFKFRSFPILFEWIPIFHCLLR